MSTANPIRLRIDEAGVTRGYVETLDFVAGASVSVTGPRAYITVSGGGGGDAATLQGHPASFFATEADLTTVEQTLNALSVDVTMIENDLAPFLDRSTVWGMLGVAVQQDPPATGITYAQWLAGTPGNFAWFELP